MTIRDQILTNQLELPAIHNLTVTTEVQAMFRAMWYAYITRGYHITTKGIVSNAISMTYWAKRINDPRLHNQVLKILADNGWITVSTRPNNNWSEAYINESKLLTYCTKTELDRTRMFYKFSKYILTQHSIDQDYGATKTKANGKIFDSGLVRNGFAKSGKVNYQFDTDAMHKHQVLVTAEINKGIEKMIIQYPQIALDHANYRELGTEIVQAYIHHKGTYNAGPRTSDPRGRNNRGDLSKIGNPISFKIMRSLLVIPTEYRNNCTYEGLTNKYLFIAQLCGFKSGTVEDKINFGRQCYYTEAHTHDEVEDIWLQRTYIDIHNAIDNKFKFKRLKEAYAKFSTYANGTKWHRARATTLAIVLANAETQAIVANNYKWQVPIEIDMSASILGYYGLLLGHKPYLNRCNITMGTLTDAWGHYIITNREQFKTSMRSMYGSQMSAKDMWNEMGIEYTEEQVIAFQYELEHGDFAPAMAMKDFIINNARMQPQMTLVINGESVLTNCNKFHNVGEITTVFDLYDSATNRVRTIHNTSIKQVPDLKSFRRYSVTGIIHNLDAQVMDNTLGLTIDKYGFAIDIHDALIECCEAVTYTRFIYANGSTSFEPSLAQIYRERKLILQGYFRSLNIPASAIKQWEQVMALVVPLDTDLIVNPMVLK